MAVLEFLLSLARRRLLVLMVSRFEILEEEETNTADLEQIKKYIEQKSNNSLTLEELQATNTEKPFNYTPWLIGGSVAVVLLVVGIIAYRSNKRKNIKSYIMNYLAIKLI